MQEYTGFKWKNPFDEKGKKPCAPASISSLMWEYLY
jgi:hypothetical protein